MLEHMEYSPYYIAEIISCIGIIVGLINMFLYVSGRNYIKGEGATCLITLMAFPYINVGVIFLFLIFGSIAMIGISLEELRKRNIEKRNSISN